MKNFKIIISAHHFKNKFLFFYRTHVVPIKDIRSLNLTFPIPDYQEHYTKKPVSYVSHLIGKNYALKKYDQFDAKYWLFLGGFSH